MSEILLSLIDPDPNQPRKYFDQAKLEELAQSIKANGLAVPILLRPNGERFIIVHGERRYKAAQFLEWESIPAEVRDISPDEAKWLSLAENVQRSDLSPIEEAQAYKSHLQTGITQEELGQRIGKTQSYIAQKLRLLTLPDPIRFYLDREAITEGHGRQLLKLKAIYTEDLQANYTEWAGQQLYEKLPEIEAWRVLVWPLLRDIRPEDSPRCWFYASIPDGCNWADKEAMIDVFGSFEEVKKRIHLISEGCQLFDKFVSTNEGKVPQWEVAAFWWASATVYGAWNIARLSKEIDLYKERFLTALAWCDVHREMPSENKKQIADWWGYRSDLEHSNALIMLNDERYLKKRLEAINQVLSHRDYSAPSSCQPWGLENMSRDIPDIPLDSASLHLETVISEARKEIEALPSIESSESLEEVLHIRDVADFWMREIAEARIRAERAAGKLLAGNGAIR